MKRLAAFFGCNQLLGADTQGCGDVKRIERRETESDGHVMGVSYDDIDVPRPVGDRLKEGAVEFCLDRFSVEECLRQYFKPNESA
jgi:hypothetical protein